LLTGPDERSKALGPSSSRCLPHEAIVAPVTWNTLAVCSCDQQRAARNSRIARRSLGRQTRARGRPHPKSGEFGYPYRSSSCSGDKTLFCETIAFWSNEVLKNRNRLLEDMLRFIFVAH
jgi:hypothetical protein